MTSLRTVASLIFSLVILQAGQGLLGVHLPLAMAARGLSTSEIGFVGACFSAGFMAGAWLGPTYLSRVGNIRLFAASAAIVAATTLSVYWADTVLLWMLNRFATGAGVAMAFAAGESWMGGAIGKTERGSVMGFYQVCIKAAVATGPFLIVGAAPGAAEPLMMGAILFAVALVPVCFTSRQQPDPPKPQPIHLGDQYRRAPAAVIGCFGSGVINAGVMGLAPIYAADHFGPDGAAGFQAAAWLGSLVLQWPAGRLSDMVDRRLVIAGLIGIAAVAALALALFDGQLSLPGAALIFAVWGAGALSMYAISVAHMADRAEPGQLTRSTSGLLFVWAMGAVAGPATLGVLTDIFGMVALFWYAAGIGVLLGAAMLWRRARRDGPTEAKTHYAEKPATSVAAADLAYGDKDDDQGELKL